MSVTNKSGHGVTGVLPSNSDAVQVAPGGPTFRGNTGSAGYNGIGKGGSGFKMSSSGKKKGAPAPNKSVSKLITK